jgi:hypothetical protein
MIELSDGGNVEQDAASHRSPSPCAFFDSDDIGDLSFEEDSGDEGSQGFDGDLSQEGSSLSSDEVNSDDEGGFGTGEENRHRTSSPVTVRGK